MRTSPMESEIRRRLKDYLSGRLSIQAFQEWFVPATWDIEKQASENLRRLVYGIELRLAEYTNGHWSPAELKDYLQPLAGPNGKRAPLRIKAGGKRRKAKLPVLKKK